MCRNQVFLILTNNSRSKQNIKNKKEMRAKFSKNIKLYGSSSLSNFSIFWRKYPVSPEQQSLT